MRDLLTKLCWPILRIFETEQTPANYKPSHRVILNVVGVLFWILALGSGAAALNSGQLGSLIPVVVFFSVGFVSLIIGTLGSDGAVSKIWGTK